MMGRPDYRAKAEWVLRRHYPTLAAAPFRAYRFVESFYEKHNSSTAGIEEFENHLAGIYHELQALKHYHDVVEAQFNVLRRIPGLVPLYRFGRRLLKYGV
jgi:hypothetical protein